MKKTEMTKQIIEQNSGVKADKADVLKQAFLPLVDTGSNAKEKLILHTYDKKNDVRVRFITPQEYRRCLAELRQRY